METRNGRHTDRYVVRQKEKEKEKKRERVCERQRV